MMMNRSELLQLADRNLAEFVREMARWNATGEILEREGLLLTKGPGSFPSTSVAVCLENNTDHEAGRIFERVRSFYRERQSPFSIHVRRHADTKLEAICEKEGLLRVSNAPGMMVERPFPAERMPEEIEIRQILDVSGVADFASVVLESYRSLGLPRDAGEAIFSSPERLLGPSNHMVLAYDQGKPVSAAMLIFSPAVAGLYWVGTVSGARGRGLARACVRAAANEAFRRGAPLVVLQASKFGAPVYRSMGFTEFTRYPWYMDLGR